MKWILMIAWAANGTGYTTQEFGSEKACQAAVAWVHANNHRGSTVTAACLNKG